MAPELIVSGANKDVMVTAAADIFAFGSLMQTYMNSILIKAIQFSRPGDGDGVGMGMGMVKLYSN